MHPYSAFRDDELLYLRYCVEGYNRTAISHEMGVTINMVHKYHARLLPRLYRLAGQPVPPKQLIRPLSEEEHQQVCQWRAAGVCWPEIGQRLQRHPVTVAGAHRRYIKRTAQANV